MPPKLLLSHEHSHDHLMGKGFLFGLIACYEGQVEAQSLELSHPYAPHACWWLRKGEVAVKYHSTWSSAKVGQVMLLPSGAREHFFSKGARVLSIRFELRILRNAFCPLRQVLVVDQQQVNQSWLRVSKRLIGLTAQPAMTQFRIYQQYLSWLEHWFACVEKFSSRPSEALMHSPFIEQALGWIERVQLDRTFKEEQLALALGKSKNHLRRLFHRSGLGSPSVVFNQRREDEAMLLLKLTQDPISSIADQLGFASASHFGSWFKARCGNTPLRFRESVRLYEERNI